MPSDLVLITGVTGHVGFKVLVDTLERGYSVRAAIRDSSKEDIILKSKSIKAINPGSRLSFVVVKDIIADGAYDEAVKGVKYVIHIASPLANSSISSEEQEEKVIKPAVKGTMAMLNSAQKTTGIKRIVITSSVVAIIPTMSLLGGSKETFDESSTADPLPAPYAHPFIAYSSSKIIAYKESLKFVAEEKPEFDIVNLMPSFIIGRKELTAAPENITDGTNALIMRSILGHNADPLPGCTVHVDDVSRAHVLSLDPKIPGNSSFILNSGGLTGTVWGDAIDIVAKNYPQAVASGVLPNNGVAGTTTCPIDGSKAERTFGFKYLSFEEQVKSVTDHYLELVAASKA